MPIIPEPKQDLADGDQAIGRKLAGTAHVLEHARGHELDGRQSGSLWTWGTLCKTAPQIV